MVYVHCFVINLITIVSFKDILAQHNTTRANSRLATPQLKTIESDRVIQRGVFITVAIMPHSHSANPTSTSR
jgi:hypothetical protein